MDRSPVRDFVVGLFVLAGLGAVAYLSISIGGFSWNGHGGLKLHAFFVESGDLTVRAPVVVAGVRVGEVTKITLDQGYRARVDMDLDSSLKLYTDATASIVTAGMLGDRYIEIGPGGSPGAQLLKSGDQIDFTEPALILEKLIGQFVYGVTNSGDKKDNKPATTSHPTP